MTNAPMKYTPNQEHAAYVLFQQLENELKASTPGGPRYTRLYKLVLWAKARGQYIDRHAMSYEEYESWRIKQRMRVPAVGDPATIIIGSDCYPATVIDVVTVRNKKEVIVREDTAIRVDTRGPFTEQQEYRYEPWENGTIYHVRWSDRYKCWRSAGSTPIAFGYRRMWRDPSI
jgi:hypothetical protein